ncbi:MAG TPA: YheC/YheD family protein [Bacillales bacterium]|nr:YheC/YheD family protein [Bacillales bacterium]
MHIQNVIVEPAAGTRPPVSISRHLYDHWHLEKAQPIGLKCGQKQLTVTCEPVSHGNPPVLELHSEVLQAFHLPAEPLSLKLAYDPVQNCLSLGPIIAVLTYLKNDSIDGPLEAYFDELARYSSSEHVLFYVFSLNGWRRDSAIGYIKRRNTWIRRQLPAPDVVHNRIGQRNLEKLRATELFAQRLRDKNIHYFNTRYLDKWQVQQILWKHRELHPHLPETVLYKNGETLQDMLSRHRRLFIKPTEGSQGKQILRVEKGEQSIRLDHTAGDDFEQKEFDNAGDLAFLLQKRLERQAYIVQQGVPLLNTRQKPLDFRMLCNKGRDGSWRLTSGVARVSSEEQFVSNLAQGGTIRSVRDVLQDTFYEPEAKHIHRLMKELALEIAGLISLHTEDGYGELGIDLALDLEGKPWLLEVNTKPSKDLDPANETNAIRPSAKAIIDYGCYLARFTNS